MFRRSNRLIAESSETCERQIHDTIKKIGKLIKAVSVAPKDDIIVGTKKMHRSRVVEGYKMYLYIHKQLPVIFQGIYYETTEGRDRLLRFTRTTYRKTFEIMSGINYGCKDPLVKRFKRLLMRYRKDYEQYRRKMYGEDMWKIELPCYLMNEIESYL